MMMSSGLTDRRDSNCKHLSKRTNTLFVCLFTALIVYQHTGQETVTPPPLPPPLPLGAGLTAQYLGVGLTCVNCVSAGNHPSVLWCLYFNMADGSALQAEGHNLPSNVYVCSGPDGSLSHEHAIRQVTRTHTQEADSCDIINDISFIKRFRTNCH